MGRVFREIRGEEPPAWVSEPWAHPAPHPLALQIAFEALEDELERKERRARKAAPATGRSAFAKLLADAMYADVKGPKGSTLSALVETLARDQARPERHVTRVITFNADDLLERAANAKGRSKSAPVLWPISRESAHIRRERGFGGRPPIPVYHVHGFLPGEPRSYPDAPDCLVFTDEQYWATVASPSSFPNRVLLEALHDSHCVFVGLSMTDVNLARWLGVRRHLFVADKERQWNGEDPEKRRRSLDRALRRHTFVRTASAPGTARAADEAFVSRWLAARGVETQEMRGWGAPFRELLGPLPWGPDSP